MDKRITNLKLSKKLLTSFLVMLILMIVIFIASAIGLFSVNRNIKGFYETNYTARGYANTVLRMFERTQKFTMFAIQETDPIAAAEYREGSDQAGSDVYTNFQKLEEVYNGAFDVSKIEAGILDITPTRKKALALAEAGEPEAAYAVVVDEWLPLLRVINEDLTALIQDINNRGDAMLDNVQELVVILLIVMVAIVVLAALIGLFINSKITKCILAPVNQINVAANELSEGNFDFEFDYESTDEFGDVVRALQNTVKNQKVYIDDILYGISSIAHKDLSVESQTEIKGEFVPLRDGLIQTLGDLNLTMRTLQDAAYQVSQGSEQLAETSQSLAEGTTDQAGAIEELQATIHDVTEQVQNNARESEDAYTKAMQVDEGAQKSSQRMDEMVQAMERISDTSKQIELIIQSIENIASQTNLLSLNAAIEAARAGEAGRGFAVVAGEISDLANQSAQAAANTRKLISDSITEVENGNKIAVATSEALNGVRVGIDEIKSATNDVKSSSDNQAEIMQQINQGIEQISSVVQNNAALAEEVSATSEELSAQSVSLNGLAGEFKLRNK